MAGIFYSNYCGTLKPLLPSYQGTCKPKTNSWGQPFMVRHPVMLLFQDNLRQLGKMILSGQHYPFITSFDEALHISQGRDRTVYYSSLIICYNTQNE